MVPKLRHTPPSLSIVNTMYAMYAMYAMYVCYVCMLCMLCIAYYRSNSAIDTNKATIDIVALLSALVIPLPVGLEPMCE